MSQLLLNVDKSNNVRVLTFIIHASALHICFGHQFKLIKYHLWYCSMNLSCHMSCYLNALSQFGTEYSVIRFIIRDPNCVAWRIFVWCVWIQWIQWTAVMSASILQLTVVHRNIGTVSAANDARKHLQIQWWLSSRNLFAYAPSQWETTLHCNTVSHWLGTYKAWVWVSYILGSAIEGLVKYVMTTALHDWKYSIM